MLKSIFCCLFLSRKGKKEGYVFTVDLDIKISQQVNATVKKNVCNTYR